MQFWNKQRVLGRGSYSVVYLATSTGFPSRVAAIKTARDGGETRSSLEEESVFLRQLQHSPFVLACYGEDTSVVRGKEVYSLLMEFAPGGTLKDVMRSHKEASHGAALPESKVACYAYQLLKGLSHVHQNGIVHCDLKPDNVLVFPPTRNLYPAADYILKIADFGLSKKIREPNATESDKTLPGRYNNRGTPLYASPESITEGRHGTATDIWSIGCIVFEMITGYPVWDCTTMDELIVQIATDSPMIPATISKLSQEFLERCFTLDPDRRWTAEMLLQHPFISRFNAVDSEAFRVGQENPFGGCNGWISSRNMFSSERCNLDFRGSSRIDGCRSRQACGLKQPRMI